MTRQGIVLCSSACQNIVRDTLDNFPSKVLAKEYRPALPVERCIAEEMKRVRRSLANSRTAST